MSMPQIRKRALETDLQTQRTITSPDYENEGKEEKFQWISHMIANFLPSAVFALLIFGPFFYHFIYATIPHRPFVRVSDPVKGRGQFLNCSPEYQAAAQKYEGCLPNQCLRYTTDNMINSLEAETLLKILKNGLVKKGLYGGATIVNLYSGAKSTGQGFVNVQDLQDDVFSEMDFLIFKNVIEKVRYGIGRIFKTDPRSLYLAHPSYFMEVVRWQYGKRVDSYWHLSFDAENYQPFVYMATIFLNDFKANFTDGRTIFGKGQEKTIIEPRKARVLLFVTGPENKFRVEIVDEGERYSLTLTFTCDQKHAIKDAIITSGVLSNIQ